MSSCELCVSGQKFSLSRSLIHIPIPSFNFFLTSSSKNFSHFIPLDSISFHSISISSHFHNFRFPSGCLSFRGRVSNFNFRPAATSGAVLTTLSTLRPCSVASSYKGLPPRVMCAHRRELVFVHTSLSRPVGDFLVIREDTLDEWFPASYLAVRSASHLVIPGACDWSVLPLPVLLLARVRIRHASCLFSIACRQSD